MKIWRFAERPQAASSIAAATLLLIAAASWKLLIGTSSMTMNAPATFSFGSASAFVGMWGVMMAAMMLPSAIPMILLYGTVSGKLRARGDRAIPLSLFAAVYLGAWLVAGAPVYALNTAAAYAAVRSEQFESAVPYMVGMLLMAAGAYQISPFKQACLRKCKSPLQFLTERWENGYLPTLRIALEHALYCLGCCAALMAVLVGAGSMNLLWVLAITVAVFAEKVLHYGELTAKVTGGALIILGIGVMLNPSLAQSLGEMPGRQDSVMRMQ